MNTERSYFPREFSFRNPQHSVDHEEQHTVRAELGVPHSLDKGPHRIRFISPNREGNYTLFPISNEAGSHNASSRARCNSPVPNITFNHEKTSSYTLPTMSSSSMVGTSPRVRAAPIQKVSAINFKVQPTSFTR
jgi:hypothetical protein